MSTEKKNLYIYDLPPIINEEMLESQIREITEYEVEETPEIIRDSDKALYSAVVKINEDQFDQVAEKLKNFNIENEEFDENILRMVTKSYPVRSLPY